MGFDFERKTATESTRQDSDVVGKYTLEVSKKPSLSAQNGLVLRISYGRMNSM